MKYKKISLLSSLSLILTIVLSACSVQTQTEKVVTERTLIQQDNNTLRDILSWWPGDYNNDVQLSVLTAAGKPIWRVDDSGKGGHIEVESHYRVIDLPAIGEHVLYVEELKHGDANNIFRQRMYTLSEDENSMVRVKLWYFNDKKKYVGAWKDLSRLSDITKQDMFPLQDECDLLVKQQGNKYHMAMQDKACVFGDNYFNYQVLLGVKSFWFRDRINVVKTDEIVSVAGDFTYHELNKL